MSDECRRAFEDALNLIRQKCGNNPNRVKVTDQITFEIPFPRMKLEQFIENMDHSYPGEWGIDKIVVYYYKPIEGR